MQANASTFPSTAAVSAEAQALLDAYKFLNSAKISHAILEADCLNVILPNN